MGNEKTLLKLQNYDLNMFFKKIKFIVPFTIREEHCELSFGPDCHSHFCRFNSALKGHICISACSFGIWFSTGVFCSIKLADATAVGIPFDKVLTVRL